jgi:hypothetical protein
MPFADGKLSYHPSGETQEGLYEEERAAFEAAGIPMVSTQAIFDKVTYQPMNLGEGIGRLTVFGPNNPGTPSIGDVAIFQTIPNDLPRVAGVITEQPQTALSHVNLKAKQNDTPNAYLKDASTDPKLAPLIGKIVKYEVTPDGIQIREATEAEWKAFEKSIIPSEVTTLSTSSHISQVTPLSQLRHADKSAVGAKAANVAEMHHIRGFVGIDEPATRYTARVPDGWAIPFKLYQDFISKATTTNLAGETVTVKKAIEELVARLAELSGPTDAQQRADLLADFQDKMKDAKIPAAVQKQIDQVQLDFYARFGNGLPTGIRSRSSSNNEDMEGFNGAGLYDSYTHRIFEQPANEPAFTDTDVLRRAGVDVDALAGTGFAQVLKALQTLGKKPKVADLDKAIADGKVSFTSGAAESATRAIVTALEKKTLKYDDGPDFGKTVKSTWASVWNYRAYEERRLKNIDHTTVAMSALVIPNMDAENANGVFVAKNLFDPNWPGFYVNVQVGESLVTNPDPSATPDEILVARLGEQGEWENIYIRKSSLTESGQHVLTQRQLEQLRTAIGRVQAYFREVYGWTDPSKAVECEFKIDPNGDLVIKQCRPWVD